MHLKNYEVLRIDQSEDSFTHFTLFADCDPISFYETAKESKWCKAMDDKITTVE